VKFKLFGQEPTLVIGVVTTAFLLLGTMQFKFLTADQAAIWILVVNGLAGAANAFLVRPIQPAAFTYVIGALAALAAAYGLNLSPEQVAGINGLTIAVLGLITRGQVSPQETRVSSASEATRRPEVQTVPEG
jgi:hypothetical protein